MRVWQQNESSASEQFPIEWSDTLLIERRLSMSDILMIGPIRFNTVSHEVESGGKTLRLTTMEARTLSFLALHAPRVCTFSQIAKEAYGFDTYDDDSDTALIPINIRHLRQKLEPDPRHPVYILTIPGVGYQLVL
jgi:DNA-binding response OmpR family regulator